MSNINVENIDGLKLLENIDNNLINLILTDPPYIISKNTGMNITIKLKIMKKKIKMKKQK